MWEKLRAMLKGEPEIATTRKVDPASLPPAIKVTLTVLRRDPDTDAVDISPASNYMTGAPLFDVEFYGETSKLTTRYLYKDGITGLFTDRRDQYLRIKCGWIYVGVAQDGSQRVDYVWTFRSTENKYLKLEERSEVALDFYFDPKIKVVQN